MPQPQGARSKVPPAEKPDHVAKALLALALIWFLAGLARGQGSKQAVCASTQPDQRLSEVARSFLGLLRVKQYGKAYELLADDRKAQMPREQFLAHCQAWMLKPRHRWDLQHRRVLAAPGETPTFLEIPGPIQEPAWHWTGVSQREGWRLQVVTPLLEERP